MQATRHMLAAALAASTVTACAAGGGFRHLEVDAPRGLEVFVPMPADNPATVARAELGRRLFFDRALSADRTVSCATCHRPEHAFADTVARSAGVHGRTARRNTPTLLNSAYYRQLTWDGRSTTLEEQVLKPIQDPFEMDLTLEELVDRLDRSRSYRIAFRRAFGEPVTSDGVARALATYLRTLRSGDTPLDRFRTGEAGALAGEARAGFELFVGKARCSSCHFGPLLSDGEFHNTGGTVRSGDPGRFQVTQNEQDFGAFRTPTLRNLNRTAPYMHDGGLATLEEVVEFYDGGGHPNPNLSRDVRPLKLTPEEKVLLVTFLRALGD